MNTTEQITSRIVTVGCKFPKPLSDHFPVAMIPRTTPTKLSPAPITTNLSKVEAILKNPKWTPERVQTRLDCHQFGECKK